jgi:SAM-dependent methyltransferase
MRPPCACGFVLRESAGIINLLTDGEAAAAQPFLEAYNLVREREQWGGNDLDLPFHARRHRGIWEIRRRTFRAFESAVARIPRGLALDVGAGNCWMTRYLDRWGFDAIAMDINTGEADGLRAGQKFINEGAAFLRVRAGMQRLPFVAGRFRLLATNASVHYADDFRAALSEFERVLTPGGMIVIIDTPFYEKSIDGDVMMDQRVNSFRRQYGIGESLARRSSYMTFNGLEELASAAGLRCTVQRVWPGWKRQTEEIRGRLLGRRIAQFPLVLLEKP